MKMLRSLLLAVLLAAVPFAALPSDLETSNWSESAASNNASPPNGFPEGMQYSAVNDAARELMGAVKRWFNRVSFEYTSGGSANAQTLTLAEAPAAYADTQVFGFIAGATNTGAATINVNALGAKSIVRPDGSTALAAGDITQGRPVVIWYDGTNFRLILPYLPVVIDDNAVTLADMEHGTQGDILYYGASGAPTRLSAGTSGQVLTTQGAGANPQWSSAAGGLSAASQAEMEAAASTSVAATPGRIQNHPGVAKCWGFISMSGGTPSLTASYNVTGITDSGVGKVTVTIATDFSSRNYAILLTTRASGATSSGAVTAHVQHDSAPAAGSFIIQVMEEDGNETDSWSELYFACFGDQ